MLNLTNFSDLQIGGETCDRTGLDNFFLRTRFLKHAILLAHPAGRAKKRVHKNKVYDWETTRIISFESLLRK